MPRAAIVHENFLRREIALHFLLLTRRHAIGIPKPRLCKSGDEALRIHLSRVCVALHALVFRVAHFTAPETSGRSRIGV